MSSECSRVVEKVIVLIRLSGMERSGCKELWWVGGGKIGERVG